MSNETIDYHTDPYSLAEKLDAAGVLRAAPQLKINLFACACCRLIWPQLPPMAQLALEVAERFATGLASKQELLTTASALWEDLGDEAHAVLSKKNNSYRAVLCCLYERDPDDNIWADYDVVTYVMKFCNRVRQVSGQEHCQLLLDIFGLSGKGMN